MRKLFAGIGMMFCGIGAVASVFFCIVPSANAVLSKDSLGARAFSKSCTITSAAAATAVHCLAAADVPSDTKAYVTNVTAKVNGATAWGTTATCTLRDTASSPVTLVTYAVAGLTNAAILSLFTANVTVATPVSLGTGATLGKGIDLVCNANGTGSDLVVTVTGVLQ